MTTALPANVGYGYVQGRLIFAVADSTADANDDPDAVPAVGTVTFTPVPLSLRNVSAGVIILPRPIIVDLDSLGAFLVRLVATNDLDMSPVGWTYRVTFQVGFEVDPFDIVVLEGVTLDLVTVVPEESSPGTVVITGGTGNDAYVLAVQNGFVGTLSQWLDSLVGDTGAEGNPMKQGSFQAPTVLSNIATVTIASNWGKNAGVGYYDTSGALLSEAAIVSLLSDGTVGLRQIGDPDFTIAQELGAWNSATNYLHGEVVTHLGARWFAKAANTNSAPSRTNVNWLHLGLWAIVATTDPGGGMMWINTS